MMEMTAWKYMRHWRVLSAVLALLIVAPLYFWWTVSPPKNFPQNNVVTIERGMSAAAIVDHLQEKEVVRSSLAAYLALIWLHDPTLIKAGNYYFERPLNVFAVAERLARDSSFDTLVPLTLPEGYTTAEYSLLAKTVLNDFDSDAFLSISKSDEGYLFPDTYYLPPDFSAEELYELLKRTYVEKTSAWRERMRSHPLGEEGVVVLASLLEREANTEESMKIVSGILQKRLQTGMRLQVDASLEYVLDRPLNELTAEDLELDSKYNTYLYFGLPPTPIGNPGLMAILAVLEPIESDYLYYLTDQNGVFRYAKTFDEHKANIAKYLK